MAESESIGQVSLDLGLNQSKFNKQVSALERTTRKQFTGLTSFVSNFLANTASTLLNQLAIGLKNFVKSSIDAASDLEEVQNVVNVTFTTMSEQVDVFAKSAMASYGLSELVAKRYMGQLGTMSKSFGYSEEQSYNLARSITQLTADTASFYNISTDEAFTKMKSIFTGETESLKELGVVMTQAALDNFALSIGMTKTTSDMSEAEKVALRYKFVMKQLQAAQGDFARTSDGWANQTRVLALRWEELKSAMGEGFIAVFSPLIKSLNTLISKMTQVAQVFTSLIKQMMGIQEESNSGTSTYDVAADASAEIAANADDTAESTEDTKKSLMGWDEINRIGDTSSSSDDAANQLGDIGTFNWDDDAISPIDNVGTKVEELGNKFLALKGKISDVLTEIKSFAIDPINLAFNLQLPDIQSAFNTAMSQIQTSAMTAMGLVQQAFNGLNFSNMSENIGGISTGLFALTDNIIFGMGTAFSGFITYLGSAVSGVITVAGTSANVALETFNQFLTTYGESIGTWITNAGTLLGTGFQNIATALNNIVNSIVGAFNTSFGTITTGFSGLLGGLTELSMTFGRIVLEAFDIFTQGVSDWTIENSAAIETFFSGIFTFAGNFASDLGSVFSDIATSTSTWWDNSMKPIFEGFIGILKDVGRWVLQIWNEWVMPILDKVRIELKTLWNNHLKPLWDNILDFIRSISEFVLTLWNKVLKPLVEFIISGLGPPIVSIVKTLLSTIGMLFGFITDVVSGVIQMVTGIIDFLTSVFTGDLNKAFDGIQNAFKGFINIIISLFELGVNFVINGIEGTINTLISIIEGFVNGVIAAAKAVAGAFVDTSGWSGIKLNRVELTKAKIPRLAEGGFVRKNQPQLAMVGDNKQEGEIIAPESKIAEAVSAGVAKALSIFSQAQKPVVEQEQPISITVQVGNTTLVQQVIDGINRENRRAGHVLIKA